jgi:outer membrane protein assembly factor BamB
LPETVRTPESRAADVVAPFLIRKVPLGDVGYYAKAGLQADTSVQFSPNSRLLVVGTLLGDIQVMDVYSGRTLWSKRIAEGMVKEAVFSRDGTNNPADPPNQSDLSDPSDLSISSIPSIPSIVYYGEQSPDGFLYAADARTGNELWKFRLAKDLESSAPPAKGNIWGIYELPGFYRLVPMSDGGVVALGVHSWGDWSKAGGMRRLSRVYRFSRDGKVLWSFPEDKPAAMTFAYMDADPAGRRVVVLTGEVAGGAPADYPLRPGSLCCLDGASGRLVGTHVFEPLKPFFDKVLFWQSVSVSPSGEKAAIGLHDGRAYIFDLDTLKPDFSFRFGAPVLISGIPVCANATYTHIAPGGAVYFQTGNSSVPSGAGEDASRQPPGPHPNANSITAVGRDGRAAWRYHSGHQYQNFWTSGDGRWMITSVQRTRGKAGWDSGVMLFDVARAGGGAAKFVYYYQVEGLSFFRAAISGDGAAIAVVEVPCEDPQTKTLRGTYQVHLIR